MANLAAVQATSTHRKAGGMKQTKVSAADPCGQAADPGGNSMVGVGDESVGKSGGGKCSNENFRYLEEEKLKTWGNKAEGRRQMERYRPCAKAIFKKHVLVVCMTQVVISTMVKNI